MNNNTFCIVKCKNKNYVIRVEIDRHSSFLLTYIYNPISDKYMGLHMECFASVMRYICREHKDLMEELSDECDYEAILIKHGFTKREPTPLEISLTNHLNR